MRLGSDAYDPGVTVTSASGYDYRASAVPEPRAVALLLAGLGLVGLMVRRRRE